MFDGARGKPLVGLLMVSTVNGHEFRIRSNSATSVSRDSSPSDFQCNERRDDSIAQTDLICISQTPLMWLAAGGFFTHLTKSLQTLCMKD